MGAKCDFCHEPLTSEAWLYEADAFDDGLEHGFCDDGCARAWAAHNFMSDLVRTNGEESGE